MGYNNQLDKKKVIFFILLIPLGFFYYQYVTSLEELRILEEVEIERILDGDTVELENSQKVRLIGINAPEKNMPLYAQATEFLINYTKDKRIYLERKGLDRYQRVLGYLYANDQNLNKVLVEEGLAHIYYYDKDEYYNKMIFLEQNARNNNRGIWEKSEYYGCLELIKLDYYDKNDENETLIVKNKCSFKIDVIIKDDATHIYKEEINPGLFVKSFKNIFNDDKDSLYIWDKKGGLLIFHRYP
jgi:micrococcal nuclease